VSHFLVLGAGKMGIVLAKDLIESHKDNIVTLVNDGEIGLRKAERSISSDRLFLLKKNMEDESERNEVIKGKDVVLCALLHKHSLPALETAVSQGAHYVDLVGEAPLERLKFDGEAKKNGVVVISGVGLSPGITNVCAARAVHLLDETENALIYVGGIPAQPAPPLNHRVVYAFSSFLNFYERNAQILMNGKERELPPLSGIEPISFPPDFADLECFYTRGLSSLLLTMKGRVHGELSKKTIRYKGHIKGIQALKESGLFSTQPIIVNGQELIPRNLLEVLLESRLRLENDQDVTLLRIIVSGSQAGKPQTHVFEMIDRSDPEKGYTSMAKTTAFPASIVGQMIAAGKIVRRGILFPEEILADELFPFFIEELAKRKVFLSHKVNERGD
jgi:lysine 6-dehydrogenase